MGSQELVAYAPARFWECDYTQGCSGPESTEKQSAGFQGVRTADGGGGRGGVKCTGGASEVKLCPDLCSDSPGHLPTLTLISSLNLACSLACLSTLLLWLGVNCLPQAHVFKRLVPDGGEFVEHSGHGV